MSRPFSLDVGRTRRPRAHIEAYLEFVRQRPCLVTGAHGVEAAHIRFAELRYGKRHTGLGEKPDDRWVVPLAPRMHREQHSMNELRWWQSKRINPCFVAALLFSHFVLVDEDAADAVCIAARNGLIDW